MRVDSLRRDPDNARRHDETDLPTTMAALKRFGQQHLLHFDPATRVIKVGNGRHEAAERLGWTWIAAVPSNLSANELRAFALADNRTAEKSRWDPEALRRELDTLSELRIDVGDVGFSEDDLADLSEQIEAELDERPLRMKPRRKTGGGGGGDGDDGGEQWKIVITCQDEAHQKALLERFAGEDLPARALIG